VTSVWLSHTFLGTPTYYIFFKWLGLDSRTLIYFYTLQTSGSLRWIFYSTACRRRGPSLRLVLVTQQLRPRQSQHPPPTLPQPPYRFAVLARSGLSRSSTNTRPRLASGRIARHAGISRRPRRKGRSTRVCLQQASEYTKNKELQLYLLQNSLKKRQLAQSTILSVKWKTCHWPGCINL
jgi:hypothetical protein